MSELEDLKRRVAELEAAAKPKPAFVRQPVERFDPTANMGLPRSVVEEMARAVPDGLVREVVAEQRRSVSLPSVGPEQGRRGTGWVEPKPLASPPGIAHCDRMVDVQDAVDRAALAKRLGVKP
jgi:hypothetical protein